LNVASGDLSVNGGVTIHGSIVAPTAAIVVNGTVHGTTASDQLVIGGSGMVAQP
jgi:cytoskeletal protein CcmA (bactofilin family)